MKSMATLLLTATFGLGQFLCGAALAQPNPADILIDEDTDDFDPGLPIGAEFPPIRALYQGQEINDIYQFIGDRGAVFLVNRSVDW